MLLSEICDTKSMVETEVIPHDGHNAHTAPSSSH